MRVTQFVSALRLESGGVVRAVLDLSAALAGRGHEVTVLSHDDSDAPEDWRTGVGEPVSSHVLPRARLVTAGWLPRLHRAEVATVLGATDVLHLHGLWTPTSRQLAVQANQLGVPYIVTLHGMLDDWCMAQKTVKKRIYLAVAGQQLLDKACFVHATAEAEREQSEKWFTTPTRIIPSVFDTGPFRQLVGSQLARAQYPGLEDGHASVLFLSRLHYKKGLDRLIGALRVLKEAGILCSLLVAGTGDSPQYAKEMQRLARRLGLDGDVHFLGFVSGPERVSLFQAVDVLALPTSQENFGFVLYEALAAGTPVVTTHGVDTWKELEESGGSLITGCAPEAIAGGIRQLLLDRGDASRRGGRGRAWVLKRFAPDRVVMEYEAMYREAVRPAPRQGP